MERRAKRDSIKSKNIFGNDAIINGWIYGTGMRVNSENGNRMAFVKCEPNTTYTFSLNGVAITEQPRYFFYDKKSYLSFKSNKFPAI